MATGNFYIVGERGYVLSVNEENSVTLLERIGTKNQLWNWDGCRLISKSNDMVLTVDFEDEVIMSVGIKNAKSQEWSYHDNCLQHCSRKILSTEKKDAEEHCRIIVSTQSHDKDQLWLIDPHLSTTDMDVLLTNEPSDNPLSVWLYWKTVLQCRLKDICGYNLNEYNRLVEKATQEMRKCADHLDEVNYDTGRARGAGSVMGITGGVASLFGIALAPLTAGVSLTLTLAGAITAASGGATQITGTIVNKVWEKKDKERVKQSAKKAAGMSQTMQELLGIYKKRFREAQEFLVKNENFLEENKSFFKTGYEYGKLTGKTAKAGYSIVQTTRQVIQGLDTHAELLSLKNAISIKEFKGFEAGLATSTSAPKVAIPFGRTLLQAGSVGAKVFAGALGVIGVGFSIWGALEAHSDIVNKSAIAKEIRRAAENLDQIRREIVDEFKELFQ